MSGGFSLALQFNQAAGVQTTWRQQSTLPAIQLPGARVSFWLRSEGNQSSEVAEG